ncbi:hypothetical protein D3C75_1200460 [compost metagenome]
MADTTDELPTVAPAGAPAELTGFQQDDRQATLGQFDGGVNARIATPDDAHVGAVLALQERVVGVGRAAGGVVRGGVLRAVDHRWCPGSETKGRG